MRRGAAAAEGAGRRKELSVLWLTLLADSLLAVCARVLFPQADWKKLRVKELRKICEDEGIDSKGFTEKDEFLKAIKAHFNIKDEI